MKPTKEQKEERKQACALYEKTNQYVVPKEFWMLIKASELDEAEQLLDEQMEHWKSDAEIVHAKVMLHLERENKPII